jgi:ankyrin repeat protein
MKLYATIFLLLFSVTAFSQSKNDQLYDAVTNTDTSKVESLLKTGADPNYKKKVMSFEISMLIWAVQQQNIKIVKLLVDYKAEVDWKDWFKTTALMYAAHTGNKPIIETLLKAGADPKAHDEQGNSVLTAAKESNNNEVITMIENLQTN